MIKIENKITNKDMILLSKHICSLSNIKNLHLDNNRISDDGVVELANNLKYMRQLNSIFIFSIYILLYTFFKYDLYSLDNKIKSLGIRSLIMNLSVLKTLKSLSISGNSYDNSELTNLKSIMKNYTQLTNVYY